MWTSSMIGRVTLAWRICVSVGHFLPCSTGNIVSGKQASNDIWRRNSRGRERKDVGCFGR